MLRNRFLRACLSLLLYGYLLFVEFGLCSYSSLIKYKQSVKCDVSGNERNRYRNVECAVLCERSPDCVRFFDIPDRGLCMGCNTTDVQTATNVHSQSYTEDSSYIGCYGDNAVRAMGGAWVEDNSLTNEKCIQICKDLGFKYSGSQFGNNCFCNDTYDMYGPAPEANCSVPCAGNSTQMCGGGYVNSVYSTF